MNSNTKALSTIWLDFINYIYMPFYILTSSIEFIRNFKSNVIFYSIVILFTIYTFFTLYFLAKRDKKAYYLLFFFYIISAISMVLFMIDRYNLKQSIYIVILIILSILWIILNFIYLIKRKKSFYKRDVAHIKKCPGCNRIIPVSMESCGKCNYLEVVHGNEKKY